MKKIYQNPEITVIRVEVSQMIAESLGFGDGVGTASGAESRESDWDDEY